MTSCKTLHDQWWSVSSLNPTQTYTDLHVDFRGESLFECHSTATENRTILSFRIRFVHLGARRKWQWPVNLFGTIGVAWMCRTSEKGPCLDPYISQQVTTPDHTLSIIMIVAVLAYTALSH